MDPVFTLQWPEFVVAERLQGKLPKKDGFSVLIPLSRQEKGFDLAVSHRSKRCEVSVRTIQVKASRTYPGSLPKRDTTKRYKHYTWFNRFDPSEEADFFVLFGMYAPDMSRTRPISSGWYKDCSLLFTRAEMRVFMDNCKTVQGTMDRMFGFGFDDTNKVVLTRGDMERKSTDYADYVLDKRIAKLRDELKGVS